MNVKLIVTVVLAVTLSSCAATTRDESRAMVKPESLSIANTGSTSGTDCSSTELSGTKPVVAALCRAKAPQY